MKSARTASKRQDVWRIKLISVGDEKVGKSCLVKRYINTIGIDFGVKSVKYGRYDLRVNFFDMAGPPEYLEVRNEFYSDTQGILLVYDATNASSFESLPLWLDELRHYLPEDAAVVVVANKAEEGTQAVGTDQGRTWAQAHGFPFVEVSASTGKNVDQAFHTLIAQVLRDVAGVPQPLQDMAAVQAGW